MDIKIPCKIYAVDELHEVKLMTLEPKTVAIEGPPASEKYNTISLVPKEHNVKLNLLSCVALELEGYVNELALEGLHANSTTVYPHLQGGLKGLIRRIFFDGKVHLTIDELYRLCNSVYHMHSSKERSLGVMLLDDVELNAREGIDMHQGKGAIIPYSDDIFIYDKDKFIVCLSKPENEVDGTGRDYTSVRFAAHWIGGTVFRIKMSSIKIVRKRHWFYDLVKMDKEVFSVINSL